MISVGGGESREEIWWRILDLRDWEAGERRRSKVPCGGEWRMRREAISLERERPEERITSPPLESSRRSDMIC